MAIEAASLHARLSLESSQFNSGLKQGKSSLTSFAGTMKSALGGAVKIGLAGMAALGAGATLGGAKLISMASDAEEMQAKFDTVFGDSANEAMSQLDKFGRTVGRNKYELREMAASVQDTFVPLGFARDEAASMSVGLTQLAIDVGSFNNQLDTDVMRDFQSAIVGNHETVRKYGIVITQAALDQELLNMGFAGGVQKATELQKVQARLNLIYAGTTDAQGDAARTAGSWANQMRRLKSTIGENATELGMKLLPVVTPILNQLGDMAADKLPQLVQGFGNVIDKMAPLGFAFQSLLSGDIVGMVSGLGATLMNLGFPTEQAQAFMSTLLQIGNVVSTAFAGLREGGVGGLADALGLTPESLGEAVQTGLTSLTDMLVQNAPKLAEAGQELFKGMTKDIDFGETMTNVASGIQNWASSEGAQSAFQGVGEELGKGMVSGIGALAKGMFDKDLQGAAASMTEAIQSMTQNVITGLVSGVGEKLGLDLGSVISGGLSAVGVDTEKAAELGESIANAIAAGLTKGLKTALSALNPVTFIGSTLGEAKGAVETLAGATGINLSGVPGFQTGGVVPGPRGAPRMIMAHGGETVAPGGGTQVIQLVVDGRVLAEVLAPQLGARTNQLAAMGGHARL